MRPRSRGRSARARSRCSLLPGRLAREMLTRRPGTQLVEFADAGHWSHDDPDGSARVIAAFLGNRSAAPAS